MFALQEMKFRDRIVK